MRKLGILAKIRQYPLAVVCLLVLVGMVVLFFMRRGVVDVLSTTEENLSSRLGVIKANQNNAPGLGEEVEALESKVDLFKERLFDREQRAINTDFFYNMEDDVDVRILEVAQTAVSHGPTGSKGPFALKQHEVIVFNISIRGSYREIVDFLNKMHQVEPFVRVSDFEIRGSRNEAEDVGMQLSARLKVLVLAEVSEDRS